MVGDPGEDVSRWHPVDSVGLGGRPAGVGVARWHLDSVEFSPVLGRFRVRGWLVDTEPGPAAHVIVRQGGKLSSFLPNEWRPDIADKFLGALSPEARNAWCGFFIDVPGTEGFDLGLERDAQVSWLRRCAGPPVDVADAVPAAADGGEAGLERVLAAAERHFGPGKATLVASREPPDSRKGRVRVHELGITDGQGSATVRVVEKRQASKHELALARRLQRMPDDAFAPVLDVARAQTGERWFIAGFVEPQTDMYLDPAPHVDALVSAVRTVNRCFADLAGEGCRPDVVRRYEEAVERLATTDQRYGARAADALQAAMPALASLPIVASHNDFYWNNLGLQDEGQGLSRVRMFDLELLGPNFAGAEFHQFARMVMEDEAFRAPFAALVGAYANAAGLDPRTVRVAALAFAMLRCGLRLHSGAPVAKRSDGSPRCEEPVAYAGLARWLAAETAGAAQ